MNIEDLVQNFTVGLSTESEPLFMNVSFTYLSTVRRTGVCKEAACNEACGGVGVMRRCCVAYPRMLPRASSARALGACI